MSRQLDLNADLGEGFGAWQLGDDEALLEIITSANVACGFHAGDAVTMRRVCAGAARHGVAVGAQVSYRDLAGFGRRFIDVAPDELTADVLYQLGALQACAHAAGAAVGYVKPHGALYNATVHHTGQAAAVVEAVRAFGGLPVLGLPGSELLAAAEAAGLQTVAEAFADRGYRPDGTLVPRNEPGALVTDAGEVAARAVRLATANELVAADGSVITVVARSVCVHGDTPGAAELAARVREELQRSGVELAPFVHGGADLAQ